MRLNRLFPGCIFLMIFLVGCSRDDGVPFDKTTAVNVPDSFARFLNPMASLAPGDYTVVAATFNAGESDNFSVTLTFDDGEKQVFEDSWSSSGVTQLSMDNPAFDFTLYEAGGIDIKLSVDADTYLFLIKRSATLNGATNRGGYLISENNDVSIGVITDSAIKLETSRIDSESFGKAYYDTIDPLGAKTTLQGFKNATGFADANDAGLTAIILMMARQVTG